MIPFGWEKNYSSHPFQYIWRKAYLELVKADSLVVIGYSLRETDFHVRDLLLRAALVNRDCDIVLIDRVFQTGSDDSGKSLRDRFEGVFHKEIVESRCFASITEYLDQVEKKQKG